MDLKPAGVEKLWTKLQIRLEDKNFYEAHQLYKIIYFRLLNQHKYQDAFDVLINGALKLITNNQVPSGCELVTIYLEDGVKKHKISTDHIKLDMLIDIFRLLPPNSHERTQYQCNILDIFQSCNEFSSTTSQTFLNKIHTEFAKILWKEKDFSQSRYHFIRCSDGLSCATMLVEYATLKGYPSETDLFIAQAVLQYLCLKNKDTAHHAFYAYVKLHPVIHREKPPFPFPLLNFLCFLLAAIQRNYKLTVFSILCDKYEPSLRRDPSFFTYLDRIGQIFFNLPPKPTSTGLFDNFFSNLMSNFQSIVGEPLETDNNNSHHTIKNNASENVTINHFNNDPNHNATEEIDYSYCNNFSDKNNNTNFDNFNTKSTPYFTKETIETNEGTGTNVGKFKSKTKLELREEDLD